MKISNLIFCLLICSILSLREQIEEIKLGQELPFNMNSRTMYIYSKNTINGVFNYDVLSPKPLNITFARYDSNDPNIDINEFDGHNETTKKFNDCLVSIAVSVSNDEKFTFLKIENLDYDYEPEPIEIKVKLTCEYTWKILLITISMFAMVLLSLFLFCSFGKNCLTNYCNFR